MRCRRFASLQGRIRFLSATRFSPRPIPAKTRINSCFGGSGWRELRQARWRFHRREFGGDNSLLSPSNSLFFGNISLLICVGNCSRSGCNAAVSCSKLLPKALEIAKFPVKFPDTRESGWRRVRSALRRQPASPAVREIAPNSHENGRQWRAFTILAAVSRLPISRIAGPNGRKSPAAPRNIPVFLRLAPETQFDRHCVNGPAVVIRCGLRPSGADLSRSPPPETPKNVLISRSNVLFCPTGPCPGYGLNRDLIVNKRKVFFCP